MTTAQEYLEKRWTALILLCVAQFIVVLDASIVNVALPSIGKGLDFSEGLSLEFEPPDLETFPLLALARQAGESGGTYPCAYNAANEVAVAAFLAGRLPFLGIAGVVAETLEAVDGVPAADIEELVQADAEARRHAESAAGALVP